MLAHDLGEQIAEGRVVVRHRGCARRRARRPRPRRSPRCRGRRASRGDRRRSPRSTPRTRFGPRRRAAGIISSMPGPHQGSAVRPTHCHAIRVIVRPTSFATRSAVSCKPSRYRHESVAVAGLARCDRRQHSHRQGVRGEQHRRVGRARHRPTSRASPRPSRDAPTNIGWSWKRPHEGERQRPHGHATRPRPARRTSRRTCPTNGAPSRCRPPGRRHRRPSARRRRDRRRRVLHPEIGAEGRRRRRRSAVHDASACAAVVVEQREPVPDRGVARRGAPLGVRATATAASDVRVVALDVVGAARRCRTPSRAHRSIDRSPSGPSVGGRSQDRGAAGRPTWTPVGPPRGGRRDRGLVRRRRSGSSCSAASSGSTSTSIVDVHVGLGLP